jgi:hypothetical protein
MQEVQREAERHNIKLLVLPTTEAIEVLRREPKGTNAILTSHVECLHSGGDCTISVAIDSGQGTGVGWWHSKKDCLRRAQAARRSFHRLSNRKERFPCIRELLN